MEGGPCPHCGRQPFTLADYFWPPRFRLARPCDHCGAQLALSRPVWAVIVVLAAMFGVWIAEAFEGFLPEAGALLLGAVVIGYLPPLFAWYFGWWRTATDPEDPSR